MVDSKEFRRKILLSTDHRVIGLQYALTSLIFLFIGFALVVIIRWQLAYPKVTGRMMNDTLGRIQFAGSLVCLNLIFLPMFIQGLAGVNRRLWDGGQIYMHAQGVIPLNVPMSYAAFALGFFQIFFIANIFGSLRFGRRAARNPWGATTLEWASDDAPPRAYRDPYEYSVPGAALDYIPQNERAGV